MSNQPPYGYPPQGGYPPPGGYQGGGFPPPSGPPQGKTKTLNLDYNIAGLLCYLPICCINVIVPIIWLTTEPRDNRFLRFHALQSLYLFGVYVVVWIVAMLLSFMSALDPTGVFALIIGIATMLIYVVVGLGGLILFIIGMVKAYQGEMWKMPIIGNMVEKNV